MSARIQSDTAKPAAPPPNILALRLKKGVYRYDDAGELEKRCPRCKEYWPADTEFFYSAGKGSGDGLSNWCKACHIEWRYPESRGRIDHQFYERKP